MVRFLIADREAPGPVEEGLEFYRDVDISKFSDSDLALLDGLEQGYYHFVVQPNIEAAGSAAKQSWASPEGFDQTFLRYVTKSVDAHVRSWSFFFATSRVSEPYKARSR